MMLELFDYVSIPPLTGDIEADVRALLVANGKPKTYEHVCDVARMNLRIAEMHGLDSEKCMKAALLHDISAVIKPDDMLKYAVEKIHEICRERGKKVREQIMISHSVIEENNRFNQDLKLFYFGAYPFEIITSPFLSITFSQSHCSTYNE